MLIKINGSPVQEIIEQAARQNYHDFQNSISLTETGDHLYTLCLDGSCAQVTRENLDFMGKLLTHLNDHYLEILRNLIGGV